MSYKINIIPRTLHFREPAGTSRGVYTERQIWLIELTSDEHPDCKGVGECAPLPDLSCDASPNYADKLRELCDAFERTGEIDYRAMEDYPSMLFGLETALLTFKEESGERKEERDLLFDTAFTRGEEGIPINGLVWMGSFDEMNERLERKLEQGFRCVKLKIGAIDFDSELELVKRIRSRFSWKELELRVDANGGFAYDDALYKLELLSQYAIHSIEQPIRQRQWGRMAELCRDAPLPIALDEELIGVNDRETKKQLLNIIRPKYIVLKPSLHGGIRGTEEWVELAHERGIGSWVTSALESNVGLNAVAQLAAHLYGPHIVMPQGLGTGQLFTDNISMPIEIRGCELWRTK